MTKVLHQNALLDRLIEQTRPRPALYDLIPHGASRILDIGCGDGGLLLRLKRHKQCRELYGVEVDPKVTRFLPPFVDNLWLTNLEDEESDLPEKFHGYFDYVIMHDVVEHFIDPWYALMKIQRYLAPNGKAVIVVPNLHFWEFQQTIAKGDFPYGPSMWHTGHLRWFTFRSLIELTTLCGFDIQAFGLNIPRSLDVDALLNGPPLHNVVLPMPELGAIRESREPVVVRYPFDVRKAYPVFFAWKLMPVLTKGQAVLPEPTRVVNNCGLLQKMRSALGNPFNMANPPAFQYFRS